MRIPVLIVAGLGLVALILVALFAAFGTRADTDASLVDALQPPAQSSGPRRAGEATHLDRPEPVTAQPAPVGGAEVDLPRSTARVSEVPLVPTVTGHVVDRGGVPLTADVEVFALGLLGRHVLGFARTDGNGLYRIELDLVSRPIELTLEQELARMTETMAPEVRQALDVLSQMERDDQIHERRQRTPRDVSGWFRDDPDLGRAFRALRALSLAGDEGLTFCVRAAVPGFASEKECFTPPEGNAWSKRVDFKLDRGGALAGRVVLDAFPAPGTSVTLLDHEFREVGKTLTLREGSFELAFRDAGLYHVIAQRLGDGIALQADVELTPLLPMVLPDLVLGGTESISGQVVYPDGSRPVGAAVEARPVEFVLDGPTSIPFERLPEELLQSDFFRGGARTGSSGSFVIAGLQPGMYELSLSELVDQGNQPRMAVETGTTDVVLTYTETRLLVRLIGVERVGFEVWIHPEGRTDSTQRLLPLSDGQPYVSCAVRADTTYWVRVRTEDGREAGQSVEIASGRYQHSIALAPDRLPATARATEPVGAKSGRLRVSLGGNHEGRIADVVATLHGSNGDPVRQENGEPLDVADRWVTVPAGDYEVRLHNEYLVGQIEQRVEVVGGAARTLGILVQLGGRVALRVAAADGEPLAERLAGELVFQRLPSAPVTHEVRFALQANGTYLGDPPVAPGPYTLHLERNGRTEEHTGVDVLSSRTVEVALGKSAGDAPRDE